MEISIDRGVAHLELNRPERANAMNRPFWREMVEAFEQIDRDTTVRCVVISGRGRHFCSGLDLQDFATLFDTKSDLDPGRERERLRRTILSMQESFNVIERCRVPVLTAVHGACIGGGVDLISACDCRYATQDAFISIQEINIGMAADVGSLQRMAHLMPEGVVRQLAFTGERMTAAKAAGHGLFNDVYDSQGDMLVAVKQIARAIADRSPLAMTGVKEMLNYTRDHTVADSLNYVATWNAATLLTEDMKVAITAQMAKTEASFDDVLPEHPLLSGDTEKGEGVV